MWNKLILITLVFLFAASVSAEMERVQVGDMIQVNLPGEETLNKDSKLINEAESTYLKLVHYTSRDIQRTSFSSQS